MAGGGAITLIFASQKEIGKAHSLKADFRHLVLPGGYEASSNSAVQLAESPVEAALALGRSFLGTSNHLETSY